MARNRVSKRNPYWIPHHRYLELYHLCRQLDDMRAERRRLLEAAVSAVQIREATGSAPPSQTSPTEVTAIKAAELSRKIDAVERCVRMAGRGDAVIERCLMRNVTKGSSYDVLTAWIGEELPVSVNTFYRGRRFFFWLLDKEI